MPSFQEFDGQPFDEEHIPDVTQNSKSALQSEKPKRPKNSTLEEKQLLILNRIAEEVKEESETKETQDKEYFTISNCFKTKTRSHAKVYDKASN